MRIFVFVLCLLLASCSPDSDEIMEYYSMDVLLQKSTYRLQEEMNKALIAYDYYLQERGKQPDSILSISREILTEVRQFSGFIDEWRDSLIAMTGGLDDNGIPRNWNRNVNIKEFIPNSDFRLDYPIEGKTNLMIALIRLSELEYRHISELHSRLDETIPELYPKNYNLILLKNVDGMMQLTSYETASYNELTIDGIKYSAMDNSINFSRKEWDQMNVKEIKLQLLDSIFTFRVQP